MPTPGDSIVSAKRYLAISGFVSEEGGVGDGAAEVIHYLPRWSGWNWSPAAAVDSSGNDG
jgi:hypothetical protein